MGEPVGDVRVGGSTAKPVAVEAPEVPLLLDEIPLLALLATQARGTSVIRGAAELRVKETDRIAAVAVALRAMGADIDELPQGFVIRGPTRLHGAGASSGGDHRLAMMLAVAGAAASGATTVDDAAAAAVSFPGFDDEFRRVGGTLEAA
jgi:3-phosphoshikimate 1-carboxyvinyltransferase